MIDESELLQQGEAGATKLFNEYRPRLLAMIDFRMDRRLAGRIDREDIVQDAWMSVSKRLDDYLENQQVSFYIWIRQITRQLLVDAQRRHFSLKRDASLERSLPDADVSSTGSMARALADSISSPSMVVMREEQIDQLQQALSTLSKVDQEILELRHFEQLSSSEVAEVLQIGRTAATNRYMRALKRLQAILLKLSAFRDSSTTNAVRS
jgi:RNA polymerase sigma-70 factor, ECF subfamily